MNSINRSISPPASDVITRYDINRRPDKEKVEEFDLAQRLSVFLVEEYQREAQYNPDSKSRILAKEKVKATKHLQLESPRK